MLLRIDRTLLAEDGTVRASGTRYYLTSIDPGDICAADLLRTIRSHWQVENSAFFVKDRWWDEDRHWTKRPGLSNWLAQLTTAATCALRIFRKEKIPLRAQAEFIQWAPRLGLKFLGLA
jgi:hypothetical protein